MAGVINNEARQRVLKVRGSKGVTVVRLKPGFNVVPDEDWDAVKNSDARKQLEDSGVITSGQKATVEQQGNKDLRAQTKTIDARALARAEKKTVAVAADLEKVTGELEATKKLLEAVDPKALAAAQKKVES